MTAYLIPGIMGLLMGLLLRWTGFFRADNLRLALGLRRAKSGWFDPLRSGLTAIGYAMALTALLCWLAVIDVDDIRVLALSLGALVGGAVFGIAAGLCGFTPTTAFAGLGAGNAAEALCVLAGCFAGSALLRPLDGLFAPLRTAPPYAAATLFKMTLDEPFLLSGGFLAQGCAGLLLAVIALCIPSPRPVILTEAEVAANAEKAAQAEEASAEEPPEEAPAEEAPEEAPAKEAPEEASAEETLQETSTEETPEEASAETFVALLEGEEPLVVDTEPAEASVSENPVSGKPAPPDGT